MYIDTLIEFLLMRILFLILSLSACTDSNPSKTNIAYERISGQGLQHFNITLVKP